MPGPAGSRQPGQAAVQWIIWGTITSALFIYAYVGHVTRASGAGSSPAPAQPAVTRIIEGIAGVLTVLIFVMRSLLAGRTRYLSFCIARWALAEAIGLCGFVLYFLGASATLFFTFLGWALVLLVFFRPRPEGEEEFEQPR